MRRLLPLILFFAAAIIPPAQAASPLVADLSTTRIEITTSFSGTDLLLFGATEGEGDVVVVVRGPPATETVRRKERVAGIWVNGSARVFDAVPGYYFVAATRPLKEIADPKILARYGIGLEALQFKHQGPYRDALIRLKKSAGLYATPESTLQLIGGRLFRTELEFPSSVPIGEYTAEVFLFRNGEQVSTYSKKLDVQKVGVEAAVYDFAHAHAALYGICAVLIALFAGWFAGVIFRRT